MNIEKELKTIRIEIAYIPITGVYRKSNYAVIDKDMYDIANKFTWNVSSGGYARTHIKLAPKKYSIMLLHHLIVGFPLDMVVDHINLDKLDNRKCNLRLVTKTQNSYNKESYNKYGYKGVSKRSDKRTKPWMAQIRVEDKLLYLGNYKTPIEAAARYNEAAKKYFGDCAWLNKI